MFDPSRLPWTCETDKSGAWSIIRDATGEFVGRVAVRYGQAVVAMPELFAFVAADAGMPILCPRSDQAASIITKCGGKK